jgi:hypothetical protein
MAQRRLMKKLFQFLLTILFLRASLFAGPDPRGILELEGYSNSDATGITSKRGRNDFTIKEPVKSGDTLFFINSYGYTGTGFSSNPAASISLVANEAWSTTANGTNILFKATPGGSTTPQTVFTIGTSGTNYTGNVGIGTSSPAAKLDILGSGSPAASTIAADFNLSHPGLAVGSNAVHFGAYVSVTSTDTTDHTSDAAHFGAGIYRSSDVAGGRTDSFTLEARNDARTIQANAEATSLISYMDALAASSSASYFAHRIRACVSTDGDCATDSAVGTLRALYIENLQGGAAGSNHAIYQEGSDDLNYFAGRIGIGIIAPDSSSLLHLRGVTPVLYVNDSAGGVGGLVTSNAAAGGFVAMGSTTSHPALLVAGNAEKIRIRSEAGQPAIGIGNASVGANVGLVVDAPAAETIGAAGTITANACGSIKLVSSAGSVTTSTTDTFSAPAAGNEGCIMHVCNSGSNTIILDDNANFQAAGSADLSLTTEDCVLVGSSGASGIWRQLSPIVSGN